MIAPAETAIGPPKRAGRRHSGNGNGADTAPDSGPYPDTGRRATLINTASTVAGCQGSRARPAQHPAAEHLTTIASNTDAIVAQTTLHLDTLRAH